MFVNFSFLKNFHSKRIHFKCCSPYRFSHQRNHSVTLAFPVLYPKYLAATAYVKNYKYLQLFVKKSPFKSFESFRRSLNSDSSSANEKKKPDDSSQGFGPFGKFFGVSLFLALIAYVLKRIKKVKKISWEEFKYEILAKGECKSLKVYITEKVVVVEVHEGAIIKNRRTSERVFLMEVPDIKKFEEKLREAETELGISPTDRVPIVYHFLSETPTAIFLYVLIIIALIWYFGNKMMRGFKLDSPFFKLKYTLVDPLAGEGKGVKFSDVAGLKEAKREIMDFVDYLKRPEVYRNLGAKVPKGALLLGPPGCGKTLLAKAVATEASVPFLSMNGSEFIEIVGGLGAARVRNLFRDAKKRSPCIIYIDEIDAIGRKRETLGYGGGEAEQTLNQLLVEMDGVVSNEGVVLLASTNRADVLDKALLRPGRFDRQILIDLPTFQERQEIFERHLKDIRLEYKPEAYSKRMAHLTPGFSGADIANVCNEAALHAARIQKQIVQAENLEYAVERVVGGTEKRTSARTPEEKKMFAYYEAGRALVGWLSKYGEALLKITIVARTDTPAGWTHFSPNEKLLYSIDDLRGKMCMGLAGRVALTLLFNRTTTAGEKDLKKVTKLAYAQVRRFGMNENIGLMSFDINADDYTLKKPYSKALGNMFDHEARRLVAEVHKEAEKILIENKDKLIKLAEELLKKETLNYEDVVELIGPPMFKGKKLVEPLEFVQSLDQAIGPEPDTPEETKNA